MAASNEQAPAPDIAFKDLTSLTQAIALESCAVVAGLDRAIGRLDSQTGPLPEIGRGGLPPVLQGIRQAMQHKRKLLNFGGDDGDYIDWPVVGLHTAHGILASMSDISGVIAGDRKVWRKVFGEELPGGAESHGLISTLTLSPEIQALSPRLRDEAIARLGKESPAELAVRMRTQLDRDDPRDVEIQVTSMNEDGSDPLARIVERAVGLSTPNTALVRVFHRLLPEGAAQGTNSERWLAGGQTLLRLTAAAPDILKQSAGQAGHSGHITPRPAFTSMPKDNWST